MDQNAPNGSGKGSWREKLGIATKELPRISDQFKEDALAEAKPAAAPQKAAMPVAKPAPMAPRPGAAKAAPPPTVKQPAATQGDAAFADRLKAQRDAAERLAEQRVAAARQRAEAPAIAPSKNGNGAVKPAERPKFSFADDDGEQAKNEAAPKAASTGVVRSAAVIPPLQPKSARAEGEPAKAGAVAQPKIPPPAQPKPLGLPGMKPNILGGAPAPQRGIASSQLPPIMPPRPQLGTAMPQPGFKLPQQQAYPYDYKPRGPMPPAFQPAAPQQQFRPIDPPGYQRPQAGMPAARGYQPPGGYQDPAGLAARREAYENFRRQPLPPQGEPDVLEDQAFADEPQLGAPQRRPQRPLGPPGRGARGQVYEDDGAEVFEDEAPATGRRRASAQDYSRAYREYEEHEHDEPRRSLWPWLLMLALLLATAIALAGGWYYMNYLRNPVAGAAGTPDAAVIAAPEGEDKTRSFGAQGGEAAADNADAVAQPPAGQVKKKLIYDRILGEQSIDGNAIVPTEEPPVAPAESGAQTEGTAEPAPLPVDPAAPPAEAQDGAADPPAAAGEAQDPAVPDPLPVPPPPGSNGQQGAADDAADGRLAEINPAGAPPETQQQAAAVIPPATKTGEPLVLNGEPKVTQEIRTRSFGVTQGVDEPEPIVDAGAKPPSDQPVAGGLAKQAAIPPVDQPQPEAVEIKPPDSGIAGGKEAALQSPETEDGAETDDAAVETAEEPPAKAVDEPAAVKKPAAKRQADRSISKKPKQKAADKNVAKKKAKSQQDNTASTEAVAESKQAAAASTQLNDNAPIGDGPLESAEIAPPAKKKSGSFFDLFRRKAPAQEQKVASVEQPAAAAKKKPAAATAEPAANAGFGVQLGSFRTEAEARSEVNRLKAKHGGKMAGMSAVVSRSQVAGSTRFRAGFNGADSRAAASQVCNQLLAAGERDCVVRRQ